MRRHHCCVISEGEGRVHTVITSWERMRCGRKNKDAVVIAHEGGWARHHHCHAINIASWVISEGEGEGEGEGKGARMKVLLLLRMRVGR